MSLHLYILVKLNIIYVEYAILLCQTLVDNGERDSLCVILCDAEKTDDCFISTEIWSTADNTS
jgi:hypothetical protein